MPKDVETRLADGVRFIAEVGGERVDLTPHHLRALAGILDGHPFGATDELRSLFAAGVLELAPPRVPTRQALADLLPWPDEVTLYLDPRAEITFDVMAGADRPLSASKPLSYFVPPALATGIARLAANLRATSLAMVQNALARERTIDPDEWGAIFRELYRNAAERAPLADYLRVVDDAEKGFRVEWLRPLQVPECPYPEAVFRLHRSDRSNRTLAVRIPTEALPTASTLVRDMHHGLTRAALVERLALADAPHHLGKLVDAIVRGELLTTETPTSPDWDALLPPGAPLSVLHLGHAGLLLRAGATWVAFDPWLVAHDPRYAAQPPASSTLPRLDAVFITHEHWDHLDTPSLLRYPPGVPVIVPRADRSAPVHPHYAAFLALGGCERVVELAHWESHELPDGLVVTAVPFTGEGTLDEGTVRNCYLAERHGKRVFVHVDSSMDSLGQSDLTDGTIARMVSKHGPVDLLYATRRQELHLGYEILTDLHPVYLGSDPRRFGHLIENCHCPAQYLANLAQATACALLVLYSEGGADWFPEDTNFLRTGDGVAFSGFEYLWDSLEQIAAAMPVSLRLSSALDAVVIADDGIDYKHGPLASRGHGAAGPSPNQPDVVG